MPPRQICGQPTVDGTPCRNGPGCAATHPAAAVGAAGRGPCPFGVDPGRDPFTAPVAHVSPGELEPVPYRDLLAPDRDALRFLGVGPDQRARYVHTHESRAAAKQAAVDKLTGRLQRRLDWDHDLAHWATHLDGGLPQRVNEVVGGWAHSAVDDPDSLGMQLAVSERFGVGNESLTKAMARWDVDLRDMDDAPLYRALAEETYDQAQEELAAAGIESLVLHRGMSFDGHDAPAWAAGWGAAGWDDHDDNEGPPLVDGVDEVEIRSLPLSSWSADPAEASAFARSYGRSIQVVFTARVPAEAVFSYPGSGFGCGPESEMVVLGVDGAVAVSWSADTG